MHPPCRRTTTPPVSRCCSTCIVRAAGQQKQYMVFSKAKGKPTTREDKPPRKFTKTDISRTMSDGVFLKEVGICHPNRAGAAGGGTKTRSSLKGEVDGWPDFSPCNKPFIVKPSKRGSAQPSQPPLIRKLQDGLEAAFGIFKQHGPKVSSTFYMVDTPQPYKLSKFEGSEEELKAFRDSQDKDNCAAELFPTCLVEPVQVDDTPKMTKQEKEAHATWGIQAVRATVCGTQLTGAGVKVAVLDTGIDRDYMDHPAFKGVRIKAVNFTTDDKTATHDVRGHGTHCLGTILGRPVDGLRIGVAPGITDVLVAKVIPDKGKGNCMMLYEALLWAWNEGANIINISLAYDLPAKVALLRARGTSLEQAADEVQQICQVHKEFYQNVLGQMQFEGLLSRPTPLIIAAGGNGSSPTKRVHVQLPAATPGVLSVAAIGESPAGLVLADFSNAGAALCAPGVRVLSASVSRPLGIPILPGQPSLKSESGTSMAAPHVAGVAALWWQYERDVEHRKRGIAAQVHNKLCGGATTKGFAQEVTADDLGGGLVQAPTQKQQSIIAAALAAVGNMLSTLIPKTTCWHVQCL